MDAETVSKMWLDHARPVMKAWLAMDDITLAGAWLDADRAQRVAKRDGDKDAATEAFVRLQSYDEANRLITACRKGLVDMLDGIRDNYICDAIPPQPADDDEEAWEARDRVIDAMHADVLSVEAAVRVVEGEA